MPTDTRNQAPRAQLVAEAVVSAYIHEIAPVTRRQPPRARLRCAVPPTLSARSAVVPRAQRRSLARPRHLALDVGA